MSTSDREDIPRLPLGPLGLHKGRLTFCGTVIPTSSEIETLHNAAPEHAERFFTEAQPVEEVAQQAAIAHDWKLVESVALVALHYWGRLLEIAAEDSGGHRRMRYGLLLAEDGGLLPFALGTWYLEALPLLHAEMERRAAEHPNSANAGALAVAMRREALKNEPAVGHTFAALQKAAGERSKEALTQVFLTLNEIKTADELRVLADALDGKYDVTPLAIKRDLANVAEHDRRLDGREGDHADGAPRLVFGVDVDAMPGAETPEEALDRQADEDRLRVLEIEAEAVFAAAGELEARGSKRRAQQLRAAFRAMLGGRPGRTPETRKRRPRRR